jgi:CBS domain-containing protein
MKDNSSSESPFHDVGSVFPDDIGLVQVEPSTTVSEALQLMAPKRYSQVPVIRNGTVCGVFSLWSLAQHLMDFPNLLPQDLDVGDIMEQLPEVTVNDALDQLLEHLNRHDAVLVNSPHGPQAIATGTDVLNYFYNVARPFVLLQEIELSLRYLIEACITGADLQACIERALGWKYKDSKEELPTTLSEMTFEDYRSIVTAKGNWEFFRGVLGANKDLAGAKLKQIRKIRNDIFHFRDSITVRDHQALTTNRDWLFEKTEAFKDRQKTEAAK